MRRIWTAIRAFFITLFNGEIARRVELALIGVEPAIAQAAIEAPPRFKEPVRPKPPVRSEAVTLLATLQREARFVDFVKEDLAAYTDAQIGAAARDVHRDCGAVLERLFALRPVLQQEEGSEVEVVAGFDAGCYRLTGNVQGEPPFRGRLRHHGWRATACEVPAWSGTAEAARIVAPVEVEL